MNIGLAVPAVSESLPTRSFRGGTAQVVAAAASAGAGVIHLAQVEVHVSEWLLAGAYLLAVALVQLGLAAAVLAYPDSRVRSIAVAMNVGVVGLWLVSRTVGLPIGPMAGMRETIGRPDAIATILEVITILAVWLSTRLPRSRPAALKSLVAVGVAALAVTLYAIAPAGACSHAHIAADGSHIAAHGAGHHNSEGHLACS